MIWFFWLFTAFVVAHIVFVASTIDAVSSYLATTRALRCFVLAFIYLMYGSLAISYPDDFGIAENTGPRAWLEFFTILSVFMTICWLLLFISHRIRGEGELQLTVDNLKRLKWREAEFDREAFAEEWRTLLTQSMNLFFRRKT